MVYNHFYFWSSQSSRILLLVKPIVKNRVGKSKTGSFEKGLAVNV